MLTWPSILLALGFSSRSQAIRENGRARSTEAWPRKSNQLPRGEVFEHRERSEAAIDAEVETRTRSEDPDRKLKGLMRRSASLDDSARVDDVVWKPFNWDLSAGSKKSSSNHSGLEGCSGEHSVRSAMNFPQACAVSCRF